MYDIYIHIYLTFIYTSDTKYLFCAKWCSRHGEAGIVGKTHVSYKDDTNKSRIAFVMSAMKGNSIRCDRVCNSRHHLGGEMGNERGRSQGASF